jgi:hypothetical protein
MDYKSSNSDKVCDFKVLLDYSTVSYIKESTNKHTLCLRIWTAEILTNFEGPTKQPK